MAETDNPDARIIPRAARYSDGSEGKTVRHEGGQSRIARIGQFIHDVRQEMKRVSWPTGNHVKNTTIITLIAVVFFATYLFLVDLAFSNLIIGLDWVLQKIAGFLGLA